VPDHIDLARDRELEGPRRGGAHGQIGSFDEVAWAVLEPNGSISFVKKQR
jgi:hypothetical protein